MVEECAYIPEIHNEIQKRIDYSLSRHAKVMVVRYDLHFPADKVYTGHGGYIRSFHNKLRQNLRRRRLDPIDLWVREQNASLNPHYHCFLLLDGNKVQSIYAILPLAEKLWASTIQNDREGLVHYCSKNWDGSKSINGCRLTRTDQDLYYECQDWLGYLAKEYTKGNAPPHMREYGGSRLTRLQTDNLQPFLF